MYTMDDAVQPQQPHQLAPILDTPRNLLKRGADELTCLLPTSSKFQTLADLCTNYLSESAERDEDDVHSETSSLTDVSSDDADEVPGTPPDEPDSPRKAERRIRRAARKRACCEGCKFDMAGQLSHTCLECNDDEHSDVSS
eukprot:5566255-Prymnesium_polylepis.1